MKLEGASTCQSSSNLSPVDKMERQFLNRAAFCSSLEIVTNLKNKIGLAIHFEVTLCDLKIGSYSTYYYVIN